MRTQGIYDTKVRVSPLNDAIYHPRQGRHEAADDLDGKGERQFASYEIRDDEVRPRRSRITVGAG